MFPSLTIKIYSENGLFTESTTLLMHEDVREFFTKRSNIIRYWSIDFCKTKFLLFISIERVVLVPLMSYLRYALLLAILEVGNWSTYSILIDAPHLPSVNASNSTHF